MCAISGWENGACPENWENGTCPYFPIVGVARLMPLSGVFFLGGMMECVQK